MSLVLFPALTFAQAIVVSPKPDKVAVTVYRDPDANGEMELGWLGGFALITETRRVSLPAGEIDLRFEGVAGGLVPQSAVVSGLGDGISEKNRDAKLLSPGTLIDSYFGQRVHLRRTSKATGKVTEQEAIVRASGDGIVVQTESGVEALRCTGLPETLLTPSVPADLSAKPTLSVRARAMRPVEAVVTLTYLTSNFDWRAHYVATLAPDGKTMSLFAWLTLANGDQTGFADADTMAVAGRLNREYVARLEPEAKSIQLNCWPSQRTHETPAMVDSDRFELTGTVAVETLVVTGSRIARPDLEAPSPVTTVQAQRENLGDLKLYRIPIPVSVASNSQKQVALLTQPRVQFVTEYQWAQQFDYVTEQTEAASQTLLFENVEKNGLGLPLPAGSFTFYTMRDGQPFLLGQGEMADKAIKEKVEVRLQETPGVRVLQRRITEKDGLVDLELIVINDLPYPVRFTSWLGSQHSYTVVSSTPKLERDSADWRWRIALPANARKVIKIRYREIESPSEN